MHRWWHGGGRPVRARIGPDPLDFALPCPLCRRDHLWELDLHVTRELAWAHPQAPTFPFICPSCGERIELSFAWRLERGHDPRRLSVAGGSQPAPTSACVLLVDDCPHGCGTRLGLQLLPDDPALDVQLDQHHECVLGGYRCPDCDGEGRLWVDPSGLSNTPTPA